MNSTTTKTTITLMFVLLAAVSVPARGDDKSAGAAAAAAATSSSPPKTPEDWERLTAPGEGHARLKSLIGKWKMTLKHADEEGKWVDSTGTAEFKPIMDGRFIEESVTCTLFGRQSVWKGWHGYDNQKQHHVSSWIDNFGTSILLMTGTWDDTTKTLAYSGEMEDPSTGGTMKVRWTMRLESDQKVVTEMHQSAEGGKEERVMEIVLVKE